MEACRSWSGLSEARANAISALADGIRGLAVQLLGISRCRYAPIPMMMAIHAARAVLRLSQGDPGAHADALRRSLLTFVEAIPRRTHFHRSHRRIAGTVAFDLAARPE
jgi:hypothetical protein